MKRSRGHLVVIPSAELRDPEAILEEKETVEELMGELVNVVPAAQ